MNIERNISSLSLVRNIYHLACLYIFFNYTITLENLQLLTFQNTVVVLRSALSEKSDVKNKQIT